jgi:hypothetical protein
LLSIHINKTVQRRFNNLRRCSKRRVADRSSPRTLKRPAQDFSNTLSDRAMQTEAKIRPLLMLQGKAEGAMNFAGPSEARSLKLRYGSGDPGV